MLNDLTNSSNYMIEEMAKMIFNHIATNQSTDIQTLNMLVNFEKNNISALKASMHINDGQVNLPSFCDLLANVPGADCQNKIVTQKVKNFFFVLKNLKNIKKFKNL
jgi:hypothetical protein